MTDMFKEVQTIDWGIGTAPLYANRKVSVIGVKGNQRQVSWYVAGEPEVTKRWVNVNELTQMPGVPIPPKTETAPALAEDEVAASKPMSWKELADAAADLAEEDARLANDPATIAAKEMELAAERDALAAQVETLQKQLAEQTTDYDGKLKAQLAISNDLMRERDEIQGRLKKAALRIGELREQQMDGSEDDTAYLEHLIMATGAELKGEIETLKASVPSMIKTNRAKHEMKIFERKLIFDVDFSDLRNLLEGFDAEGWEIAYETYTESRYFARLIRPAQTPAYTPQPEARAAVEIPAPEPEPEPIVADDEYTVGTADWEDETDQEPEPVQEPVMELIGLDLPPWKRETDPVKQARMIYDARKETLGPKAAGRFIAEQRARENRQRAQGGVVAPQPHVIFDTFKRDQERHAPQPEVVEMVKVGNLFLDPKKFPIASTIVSHGIDATIDAMNGQVKQQINAALGQFQAQRTQFAALPQTLG